VPAAFGEGVAAGFPGLVAGSGAAEKVLAGFRERTLAVHPGAGTARAGESASDTHDMAGITRLADELSPG